MPQSISTRKYATAKMAWQDEEGIVNPKRKGKRNGRSNV
jgi:hypothetical protein